MSFSTPAANDAIEAQDIDLIIDALTSGAFAVGSQWLGVPTAPTTALGAATGITGTGYVYAVTFVVARQVGGAILGESLPGPSSSPALAPTNQKINLSAIPVSTNPRCTGRRVYRCASGGGQLKLVTTINDNTSTTYTDSLADGSLGANIPTTDSADQSVLSSQTALYDMAYANL